MESVRLSWEPEPLSALSFFYAFVALASAHVFASRKSSKSDILLPGGFDTTCSFFQGLHERHDGQEQG